MSRQGVRLAQLPPTDYCLTTYLFNYSSAVKEFGFMAL